MRCLFFTFMFLGLSSCILAQKVTKDDPSYIHIDIDDVSDYFVWSDQLQKRSASYDTINNPDQLKNTIPLKLQSDQFDLKWMLDETVFLLDTAENKFYGNPLIFKKLSKASGVFGSERSEVAEMQEGFWPESKKERRELGYVLMRYGVLELYSHLYAEVITVDEQKKEDGWHIQYKCLWHYCTNDCYDPVYTFEIVFSEADQKIFFEVK